jgi:outer membrane protein OmpA-like peptidoglycan-associated protein
VRRMQSLLQSRASATRSPARIGTDVESERRAQLAATGRDRPPRGDFSGVKIHTDTEAAETAAALGARAFSHGRDIFFGRNEFAPHTAAGRALLNHEMEHVLEQSAIGRQAVQFAPRKRPPGAGIGIKPPKEKFIRMRKPGAEKGFVLFKQDSAALAGGVEKELKKLVKGQSEPLLVKIHGYASAEGKDEYNVNLSAHRAVAIKHFLEKHLPPGSKVVLYAHGEESAFGTRRNNRRVGVWFGPKPVQKGVTPKISLKMRTKKPQKKKPPTYTPLYPVGPIGPFKPLPPLPPPSFRFGKPLSLLDDFQLDWRGLAEPGAFRGRRLSGRDAAAAELRGRTIYGNMLSLGVGHGVANWWSNRVLQSTFDARLALEHPSLLDLSPLEMKKFDPNFSQIVVPVMTPEILNWLVKKTFKKDIDFHFDFPK